MEGECLGCGAEIDFSEGECPECGWDLDEFRGRGRYGLARPGHGEPDDDGGSGPPPGPDSVTRV